MKTSIQISGQIFTIDLSAPIHISIPMRFNDAQPNAYGVSPAISTAFEYGTLVGDTRRGGSCNFEQATLIPHCNGTHTECVGHITNERISIHDCLKDVFVPAILISVGPEFSNDDLVISIGSIQRALADVEKSSDDAASASVARTSARAIAGRALIVRTLPNDNSKLDQLYDEDNIPPYFTEESMRFIVEQGFTHFLVDLPSIDRLFDDGKLLNHRIFWEMEPDSFNTKPETRIHSTITELIYVSNDIPDAAYLLNLQVAPFALDASPSRPVIFRILGN